MNAILCSLSTNWVHLTLENPLRVKPCHRHQKTIATKTYHGFVQVSWSFQPSRESSMLNFTPSSNKMTYMLPDPVVHNRRWCSAPRRFWKPGQVFSIVAIARSSDQLLLGMQWITPQKRMTFLPHKTLRFEREKIISHQARTSFRQNRLHVEPQPTRILYDAYHWGQKEFQEQSSDYRILLYGGTNCGTQPVTLHPESATEFCILNTVPEGAQKKKFTKNYVTTCQRLF